jgi:hypothetical protein
MEFSSELVQMWVEGAEKSIRFDYYTANPPRIELISRAPNCSAGLPAGCSVDLPVHACV